MRIPYILTLSIFLFAYPLTAQNLIDLVPIANGFNRPVDISSAGDTRLFITEQDGVIKIINAAGTVNPTPFIDINGLVNSGANERGLLGLTFHPNYSSNGYFFVNYINNSGDTRISRFSVDPTNPDLADDGSELVLMTIDQPFSNHNAGDLEFGPDGYLYIGLGDGGSGGDPGNRSQDRQNRLGKMLRIDVDSSTPFAIPPDNPFVNDPSTLDEIWAIGLRNPWRFSFDRSTGDMFIADVGQDVWEEIDFQPAGSTGGENYGWRCYEGNSPFNTSNCGPSSDYTFPIHEYINSFSSGCSVTGGYVYRGNSYPGLQGKYIYADFCTGNFWWLEQTTPGNWTNTFLGEFVSMNYSTFGENVDGELFVAGLGDGTVYEVTDVCSSFELNNDVTTNATCENDASGSIDLTISSTSNYSVNWSNGAMTENISDLAPGNYSFTATDANSCVIIKSYSIGFDNTPITPVITFNGSLLSATSSTSYQWYADGMLLAGETNQTLVPNQSAAYTVTTVDANGCIATSISFDLMSGIVTTLWLEQFDISPNPVRGKLLITWTLKPHLDITFKLVNIVGQTLWRLPPNSNKNNVELDLTEINSGIYFLHAESSGKETVVRRIVKQ